MDAALLRRAADRIWELSAKDQENAADRQLCDDLHAAAAGLPGSAARGDRPLMPSIPDPAPFSIPDFENVEFTLSETPDIGYFFLSARASGYSGLAFNPKTQEERRAIRALPVTQWDTAMLRELGARAVAAAAAIALPVVGVDWNGIFAPTGKFRPCTVAFKRPGPAGEETGYVAAMNWGLETVRIQWPDGVTEYSVEVVLNELMDRKWKL